jgi:hypothetical protein
VAGLGGAHRSFAGQRRLACPAGGRSTHTLSHDGRLEPNGRCADALACRPLAKSESRNVVWDGEILIP